MVSGYNKPTQWSKKLYQKKGSHNIYTGEKREYINTIVEMAESDHRAYRSRLLTTT